MCFDFLVHANGSPDSVERFLTPNELGCRWRWHPESIRRWTGLGKLPIVKIGRRTLIPLRAIEAVEADGRIN
jgi:hypothetical protein